MNRLNNEKVPVKISISGIVLWLTTIIGSILIAIMTVMFAIRCIKEMLQDIKSPLDQIDPNQENNIRNLDLESQENQWRVVREGNQTNQSPNTL